MYQRQEKLIGNIESGTYSQHPIRIPAGEKPAGLIKEEFPLLSELLTTGKDKLPTRPGTALKLTSPRGRSGARSSLA